MHGDGQRQPTVAASCVGSTSATVTVSWLSRTVLVMVAVCLGVGLSACPEWLDVDDGELEEAEPTAEIERGEPVFLPEIYPRVTSKGPLIPGSPGLRVPKGYFARARLDVADVMMPWAYASFARGDGQLVMRLYAVSGPYVIGGPYDGTAPLPVLRGVIHLFLPDAANLTQLVGVDLSADALKRSTVALRMSAKYRYLVSLERLTIEAIGETAISGSFEGTARRGAKAKTSMPLKVSFVAFKALLPHPK